MRRLLKDSFFFRLNSLLINCRSFRVLTMLMLIRVQYASSQRKSKIVLPDILKKNVVLLSGKSGILHGHLTPNSMEYTYIFVWGKGYGFIIG